MEHIHNDASLQMAMGELCIEVIGAMKVLNELDGFEGLFTAVKQKL